MLFHTYHTPPLFLQKVNELCQLLWRNKTNYEHASGIVADKQLRRTILTLAQETNQYASELFSQIQILGGNFQPYMIEAQATPALIKESANEYDVLGFCELHEKKLVNAYRDILNESYLYDGLRKLIRYQLNGILCTFTQIRLLYSLRLP